jgi:hypothetical protein
MFVEISVETYVQVLLMIVSPRFLYVLEESALVRICKEVYPSGPNATANTPPPYDATTSKSIVDVTGGHLGFEG